MDSRAFFSPDGVTADVSTAIELALIFKGSPFEYLRLPSVSLAELYKHTVATLERLKPSDSET